MNTSSSVATSSSEAVDSGVTGVLRDDETKPLWKYVTRVEKASGGGGNVKFECNFCKGTYTGSYTRLKAHLLKITGFGIGKCSKVTTEAINKMKREVEQAELKVKETMPKEVPLPSVGGSSTRSTSFRQEAFDPRKRKAVGNTAIEKAFNAGAREDLQAEIARMFFTSGLPFHLARNPHYMKAFTMACNSNLGGFVPPGYNMLRTTLLEKERANVELLLQPVRNAWKDKGVSIVSDGWTDAQRRPLINFIAVSEGQPIFLKAVNCEGEYKDKHFISGLILKTIEEVGATNVVQVITDNAPVCRAAGLLVEATHPHIFWTPCVVHTLNLALKNICAAKNTEANEIVYDECSWITIVAGDASMIKNFIMNHSMRLAIFNKFVKLKMLSIADTRFASVVVMLKRFKLIKKGLQNMVISDQWSMYRDEDVGKAQFVKEKVLDDLWWDKVDYILSFTDPIYDMLRLADTDRPCLHLVYDMWDTMIENVKTAIYRNEKKQDDEESSFYTVVHNILVDRWNKSSTPLHCMAHSLNPRYYSHEWLSGAPNRLAPHQDAEIAKERKACMQKFFPNAEERRMVNIEFAKFSSGVDDFRDSDSLHDRGVMDPKLWWAVHGDVTPKLQRLALKLLGQPCSSSCCERNWSTYAFINSVKRNKMAPQRGEDLVYVHNNLRLLSRKSPNYHEGESKMWDVGGDGFDSLDGAGVLEIAELSLDEPDLEAMIFLDGDDDDDVNMDA